MVRCGRKIETRSCTLLLHKLFKCALDGKERVRVRTLARSVWVRALCELILGRFDALGRAAGRNAESVPRVKRRRCTGQAAEGGSIGASAVPDGPRATSQDVHGRHNANMEDSRNYCLRRDSIMYCWFLLYFSLYKSIK